MTCRSDRTGDSTVWLVAGRGRRRLPGLYWYARPGSGELIEPTGVANASDAAALRMHASKSPPRQLTAWAESAPGKQGSNHT